MAYDPGGMQVRKTTPEGVTLYFGSLAEYRSVGAGWVLSKHYFAGGRRLAMREVHGWQPNLGAISSIDAEIRYLARAAADGAGDAAHARRPAAARHRGAAGAGGEHGAGGGERRDAVGAARDERGVGGGIRRRAVAGIGAVTAQISYGLMQGINSAVVASLTGPELQTAINVVALSCSVGQAAYGMSQLHQRHVPHCETLARARRSSGAVAAA